MAISNVDDVFTNVKANQTYTRTKSDEALALSEEYLDALSATIEELHVDSIPEDQGDALIIDPINIDLNVPIYGTISTPSATLPFRPLLLFPDIEIGNVPVFNETSPVVTIPNAPIVILPSAPSEPDIEDISTPNTPLFVLPNVPTIQDFQIPDAPIIAFPLFASTSPEDNIAAFDDPFVYEEQEYTSELKDELDTKLKNDVTNGGTGLDPEVEQAIWDRGYERDSFLLEDEINKTIATWNSRGFSMPNGALAAQIRDIQNKFETIRADRNRDIIVKQAELAQTNTLDARDKALRFITMELDHFHRIADRAFQVAKSTVELGISLFNVQVSRFNALLERYKTEAQVYDTVIRGELAKLELFKTQLEGVRLSVDIQRQYIDIYNAQLQGVTTLVNIYKTEMEAANIRADIQRAKLQVFQAQVQAYEAQVRAKAVEFDLYRGRIDGEKAKVEVYATQASAYNSLINGYRASAESKQIESNIKLEENRSQLEFYKTDVEVYRTQIQTALDTARISQANYTSLLEAYRIRLGVQEVDSRLALEQQRMEVARQEGRLDRAVKISETNIANLLQASLAKGNLATGGANIFASYASTIANALQSLVSAAAIGSATSSE